jgi:glycogen(starch) synthase
LDAHALPSVVAPRSVGRLRILFWNQSFLPTIGGVEAFTARLAGKLIARGHDALVIADRYPGDLPETDELDGIPVRRLGFFEALTMRGSDPRAALRAHGDILAAVSALKRTFRPDVVHVNLADASPFFHLRTIAAHPCPTVVTLQAALSRRATDSQSVTASLLRQSTRIVAISRAAAANLVAHTDQAPAEIDIIAPGIPVAEFAPTRPPAASPIPTVAFLGRLVPEKGAQTAIEAVGELAGAARLRVIGDGPERPRLQALVRARDWQHLISFEGAVDDAERCNILSESFALIVPSRHEELFGMVAVEGALCGLPVVASAKGGLQEIVEPGVTGYLAPPDDASAFACHLRSLLADPGGARRMGAAGRAKARALYTIELTADRYEQLYADCVAAGRRT